MDDICCQYDNLRVSHTLKSCIQSQSVIHQTSYFKGAPRVKATDLNRPSTFFIIFKDSNIFKVIRIFFLWFGKITEYEHFLTPGRRT